MQNRDGQNINACNKYDYNFCQLLYMKFFEQLKTQFKYLEENNKHAIVFNH